MNELPPQPNEKKKNKPQEPQLQAFLSIFIAPGVPDTFAELPGSPNEKGKGSSKRLLWLGGWFGPVSNVPATVLGRVKGIWLADASPWLSHSPLIIWAGS